MMSDKFYPQLKEYEECWPVRSLLKLRLKYGSEASRRAALVKTSKRLQAAVRNEEDDDRLGDSSD